MFYFDPTYVFYFAAVLIGVVISMAALCQKLNSTSARTALLSGRLMCGDAR